MSNLVAIVGRPNVGKSTLFNRLVGQRKAIVDDYSGVTRDRHYGEVEWCGRKFNIVDTGGFVPNSDDIFESAIRNQVKIAIDEAQVLLFMMDVSTGITDLDISFAKLLRKSNKPVLVVINKVDNSERVFEASEFYRLGFEHQFTVSSISGSGTGELLDEILNRLPDAPYLKELESGEEFEPEPDEYIEQIDEDEEESLEDDEEFDEDDFNEDLFEEDDEEFSTKDIEFKVDPDRLPRVAIIGRPNVGKSSLVNALLGENRNIVTDIAGTTRDSIDTLYNAFGKKFILVDTAGVRRKAKVKEDIEFYSVMRSINSLENSDVVVLVMDATIGMDSQDMNLVHLAVKNGKGLVVVMNKWDLIEKDHKTAKAFETLIKEKMKPFDDVPVLFTSAIEKQRIHRLVETALAVYENRSKRIPTHKLNEVMLEVIKQYPPPATKGKFVKIKFVTQIPGKSPKFAFFCNLPQYVSESYKRYLENQIRDNFNFHGVPIVIFMRKK
ncbi:MAG: ribosome biogenesis GTPase Der [Bacteroidia bacterium]|jgi:GTP-binding protein|nr:ribosome biogenesis GTPase Der [Bacteroidia bacterium]